MFPAVLDVAGYRYELRRAVEADVPAIVALLADDPLGATREHAGLDPYLAAFREVDADPNQCLVAVRDAADVVVVTMQLTILPGLSRGGAKRLQIEAVRVADGTRGDGLGAALFEWAHNYGRHHGATLVQLTSDKTRQGALRFYRRLGYEATHEGFKLRL